MFFKSNSPTFIYPIQALLVYVHYNRQGFVVKFSDTPVCSKMSDTPFDTLFSAENPAQL